MTGIAPSPAKVAKVGKLLLTAGKLHKHHILPQKFRTWFAQKGIRNIDDYTIPVSSQTHLKGLHGKGLDSFTPGKWNDAWSEFISKFPNATPSEIFYHAETLLHRYGLEFLKYVPY